MAFDYPRAVSLSACLSRSLPACSHLENILGIKWRSGEKNRFDTAHRVPLTNRSRTSWHSQNFNSYPSTPERTIQQHSRIVSTRRRRRAAIVCLYVYVAVTKSQFQLSFQSVDTDRCPASLYLDGSRLAAPYLETTNLARRSKLSFSFSSVPPFRRFSYLFLFLFCIRCFITFEDYFEGNREKT